MLNISSVAGATEEQQAAYAAFVEAQQKHNATPEGPARLNAALEAGEKWKAFLRTCEEPKAAELEEYRKRIEAANADLSKLHNVATSAYAMLRGAIDIGGFNQCPGDEWDRRDLNLCNVLLHDAHACLGTILHEVEV